MANEDLSPIGLPAIEDLSPAIPGTPSPSLEPGIHLQPAVVDGVDQTSLKTRALNRLFFANDPTASANYLRSQGYEPPEGGFSGGTFKQGGLGEYGRTAMDIAMDTPRNVAMGVGALAGIPATIFSANPVVGGAVGVAGAGAMNSAASAGLSELGSYLTGVENDPSGAAIGGGVEGVLGETVGKGLSIAGQGLKAGAGRLAAALSDGIDKLQAYSKINEVLGIEDKVLGAGVLEAAEQGAKAPVPYELNVENPIYKIYDHLSGILKRGVAVAKATGDDEIVAVQKEIGREIATAGKIVGDSVDKISETDFGKQISASELKKHLDSAVTEAKRKNFLTNSQGGDISETGKRISDYINSDYDEFINGFTDPAKMRLAEIDAEKLKLIPRSKVSQKPLPRDAWDPAVAQQIDNLDTEALRLDSFIQDPKVSFKDFWKFKRELQNGANFAHAGQSYKGRGPAKDISSYIQEISGKTSDWLEGLAKDIEGKEVERLTNVANQSLAQGLPPPEINFDYGTKFIEEAKNFSILSDGAQLFNKAAGRATKLKEPISGLATDVRGMAKSAGAGILGALALGASPFTGGAVGLAARIGANTLREGRRVLSPSEEFAQAVKIIPTPDEAISGARYRSGRLAEMAQAIADRPKANPIIAGTIGRGIAPFITTPDANSQSLKPLQDGIILSTLVDSGMVPPEARQSGFDFNQIDPATQQKVSALAKQVLQPLEDAIRFGNEDEIGAAYSQVAKQFPELFPAPKTGIKGEVQDSRGRIRLFDPTDRARYAASVHVDSEMDWSEKAEAVSELNSTFTVIKPKKY